MKGEGGQSAALFDDVSVAYVEAGLAEEPDELFYGLEAAVGALVARALWPPGRSPASRLRAS